MPIGKAVAFFKIVAVSVLVPLIGGFGVEGASGSLMLFLQDAKANHTAANSNKALLC